MVVEAVVVVAVAVAAVVVFEVAAPQPGTIFDPPNAEVSTDFLLSSSTREDEVVVVVVVPSSEEEEVVEVADEAVGIVVCSCDSFCVGVAVLVLTLPTTRPLSNPPEGWEVGAVDDDVIVDADDEGRVTALPV